MSDFRGFGTPSGGSAFRGFNTPTPPRRRNIFERIFAPFEAPQQFAYSLTREVAEDGFQLGDILTATTHAAKYFNPFSNQERIDENEIRQILFGQDPEDQEGTKWWQSGLNLGLAIMYDPLWMLAPVKAAKAAGTLSPRAARIAENIIHPARNLFDLAGAGTKAVGRGIHAARVKAYGPDVAEKMATSFANNWISQWAGMPTEAVQALKGFQQKTNEWRRQTANVIRQVRKIGGRKGDTYLREAMEMDAYYFSRRGVDLTNAQKKQVTSFTRRLSEDGIDQGMFDRIYDAFRSIDDSIGAELLERGIISTSEFADYKGVHLRRVFMAFERPEEYITKIEALVDKYPRTIRTDLKGLENSIRRTMPDIDKIALKGWSASEATSGVQRLRGLGRYVDPNTRKFQMNDFVRDIDRVVRESADAPLDTVMGRVKRDILGLGSDPLVWEGRFDDAVTDIFKSVANHVQGNLVEFKGAQAIVDVLKSRIHGQGSTTWRTMKENLDLVSARVGMPDEIKTALGEVLTASPRMAREAGQVAELLEFRKFADFMTGARRITGENWTEVSRLRKMIQEGKISPEEALRIARETIDPEMTSKWLAEGVEGGVVNKIGTRLAGSRDAIEGAAVRLPETEALGSLSGQWVKPAVARMVNSIMTNNPSLGGSVSEDMMRQFGRAYRSGVGQFKAFKVIWDPVGQARNIIGNWVLADFMGVQAFKPDLVRKSLSSIRSYAAGVPDQYAQKMLESGYDLFGGTFSATELKRMADGMSNLDITTKSPTTLVARALDNVFGAYERKMGDVFQFNEEFFKMAVFIDKYEGLKKPLVRAGRTIAPDTERRIAAQAAAMAEEALFNYGDIPYMAQWARDYGVIPFITFPIKATGLTAKTLYEYPSRILKFPRASREFSDWFSGGPEQTAQEVDALPKYLRDSMVIRLPFEDQDGRPLYVDFSYFMPYAVVKELASSVKMVQGLFGAGDDPDDRVGRNVGLREGYFNPPIFALLDMFRRGEDSLGRSLRGPGHSTEEVYLNYANALMEFVLPPSFPFGARTETLGRALQAVSRTESEPVQWAEYLGTYMRGPEADSSEAFTYPGVRPATGAAVGGAQGPRILGGLFNWATGLEVPDAVTDPSSTLNRIAGIGETLFMGGSTASDPYISARQQRTRLTSQLSDIGRQLAQVRSNPNLTPAERDKRIRKLFEERRLVVLKQGR